jgi:hypothetical protein
VHDAAAVAHTKATLASLAAPSDASRAVLVAAGVWGGTPRATAAFANALGAAALSPAARDRSPTATAPSADAASAASSRRSAGSLGEPAGDLGAEDGPSARSTVRHHSVADVDRPTHRACRPPISLRNSTFTAAS